MEFSNDLYAKFDFHRRLGFTKRHGKKSFVTKAMLRKKLYRDMVPKVNVNELMSSTFGCHKKGFKHFSNVEACPTGGIYNLDFCPDG